MLATKKDEYTYLFGELVFIATKNQNRHETVWYLCCPECGERHRFNRKAPNQWLAVCRQNKVAFYIEPKGYFREKREDFSKLFNQARENDKWF